MKNLSMIVWLSQLGLSVAVPPVITVWLAVWVKNQFSLGVWVIWIGVALGLYCAVTGLISSLRTMERMSRKEEKNTPPAFNDHA